MPSLEFPFTILRNDHSMVGRYDGTAAWRSISPHYFDVFRIRLLRGRMFAADDNGNAAGVAVINRAMMRRYWPQVDANPIGAFMTIGKVMHSGTEDRVRQIIGVIADVREGGLDDQPAMYVPVAQVKDDLNARNNGLMPVEWAVRTKGVNPSAVAAFERELISTEGGEPIGRIRSMHQVIAASFARAQFYMTILTVFAVVALVLAGTGLYGLVAYSVEQRRPELAIRAALGAGPSEVCEMIVFETFKLVLTGAAVGIPLALVLARLTISFIFGIRSWDPVVLVLVSAILAVVALAAAAVPSIRATHISPAAALRL